MTWHVRRATDSDVPGLARVNVSAWRGAYRGIVPDEFLDRMDVERRAAVWTRWVAAPPPDAVFVATSPDTDTDADTATAETSDTEAVEVAAPAVVAYCAVAAAREARDRHPELATGELLAIYADPAVWGASAGHALHEAGMAQLAAAGFQHAVLWVFRDNVAARGFYERHGWRCDEVFDELEIAGARPVEVRYSRPVP